MTSALAAPWRYPSCGALPLPVRRVHARWCSYGATSRDVLASLAVVAPVPVVVRCKTCGSINQWHAPHCRGSG